MFDQYSANMDEEAILALELGAQPNKQLTTPLLVQKATLPFLHKDGYGIDYERI